MLSSIQISKNCKCLNINSLHLHYRSSGLKGFFPQNTRPTNCLCLRRLEKCAVKIFKPYMARLNARLSPRWQFSESNLISSPIRAKALICIESLLPRLETASYNFPPLVRVTCFPVAFCYMSSRNAFRQHERRCVATQWLRQLLFSPPLSFVVLSGIYKEQRLRL